MPSAGKPADKSVGKSAALSAGMPTTNSSQFECSDNELAAGAHDQPYSC